MTEPAPPMSSRWIGAAGLTFCGLAIVAFFIAVAPEADVSDEKLLDWYGESGNQARFLASSIILASAIVALMVFVVGLKRLLAEAGSPGVLVDLTLVGGVLLGAVVLVAVAVGSSVAATLIFSDTYELDANGARLVLTAGNIWLSAIAGIPAALFLGSVSLAARRSGALPRWLIWLGFVLTPLVFLAFPGFGANLFLALIWVLAASIALLRRTPS